LIDQGREIEKEQRI